MRRNTLTLFLAIAFATSLQIGCGGGGGGGGNGGGGGGGPNSGGSGDTYFATYTLLANGGAWQNATINGSAVPATYACNPDQGTPGYDPNCLITFSDESTGTAAEFIWNTDALPAQWDVAAEADSNCPEGANSGDQQTDSQGYLDLYCGVVNGANASAYPTACTITYVNGVQQGSCPSTIQINANSPTYPTSYALDTGTYLPNADNVASYQGKASSSSSITVPAPTNFGLNIITVWDPTNNNPLAAAGYTLHECIVTTNGPYGYKETCPY